MASTPAPLLNASSKITGISYYGSQLYYTSGSCMYSFSAGVTTVVAGISSLSAQTADGAYPTTTPLVTTMAVCTDLNGNKYIVDKSGSDNSKSVIVKMPTFTPLQTGLTYNLAGTNAAGTFTNSQPAYSGTFRAINGICYDGIGNLYVCDTTQHIIARMGINGIMNVYAGTLGLTGSTGDGSAATSARLSSPSDIKMSRGNILYIADTGNNRIRRVKMGGTIDKLNFTGSTITSPTRLAFDSNENLYVVGSGNIIYKISVFGVCAVLYTSETPIQSITFDRTNNLYFCTSTTVSRLVNGGTTTTILSGLTAASGIAIDVSNILYVSDSSTNKVFRRDLSIATPVDVNTLTSYIGNGEQEPSFSITGSVASNLYGNAGPPTTRALTSPRAIVVNPSQGLLVAQPTKVTLLATASSTDLPLCANKISHISIRNNSTTNETMYLSQIVALNTSGINVLLRSANVSYVDGTYACKSKDMAYAILPKMTLTIPIVPADDITVVLLYPSYTDKAKWNGATIRTTPFSAGATNNIVRIIQGIGEGPSVKNFVIDYRMKSATCAPYINFMNKYKLQSGAAAPSDNSYREKWVRYVRILPVATTGTPQITGLKRVYVIDGETGEDRIVGKLPNVSINIINSGSDGTYGVQSTRNNNLIRLTTSDNVVVIADFPTKNGTAYYNSVTISDVWLEYDLMDEYPIERVILDQGSGSTSSLKVAFFTSSRVLVENPTASITFSGQTPSYTSSSSWSPSPLVLSPVVTTTTRGTRYIRVVNGSTPTYTQATLTLSGLSPLPTGLTNLVADTAGNVYAVNTQAVYKIAGQTGAIMNLFDTGSTTTSGLGVDRSGNIYITDSGNHLVRKRALDGTITTLVGTSGTTGFIDGRGINTRFNGPRGIVVDANGNTYVADTGNNAIRMINPYGVTRTLVSSGLATPRGVAIDGATNTLYITDSNAVRTVTGNTDLYTAYTLFSGLAPSSPVSITTNLQVLLRAKNYSGTGSWPDESGNSKSATMAVGGVNQKNAAGNGIVLNGSTYWTFPALPAVGNACTVNVWFKQTGTNVGGAPCILTQEYGVAGSDMNLGIRALASPSTSYQAWIYKFPTAWPTINQTTTLQLGVWTNIQITWNGSVITTYINGSSIGTSPITYSITSQNMSYNIGKRWDINTAGNDYVRGEIGEVRVYNRALTAAEVLTAYNESLPDFNNPQAVYFNSPQYSCIDPTTGDLYITEAARILKLTGITPTFPANTMTGPVQTLPIGMPPTNGPYALTVSPTGTLITANGANGKLKSYTAASSVLDYTVGRVTTVAGDGTTAQLNGPNAVAVDSNGNILVADRGNSCIRIIRPDGTSTVIAGASGTSGTAEGAGTTAARFSTPSGIALDSKGNVYVSDTNNNRIRRLTPDYATGTYTVSTFAGGAIQGSSDNSVGTSATFRLPLGICIDSNDNIYVADSGNHCIRMITSVGAVSTIAGTGISSFVDGIGTVARFNSPWSIAVDSNFNLYVGDNVNDRIRKIIPSSAGWTVSTLAGGAGYGFLDGTGNAAKFSNPAGVAVDSCNNVYVADNWSHRIRKITPGGIVTTLAGSGSAVFADGIGAGASFNTPRGMCIDKSNNLYIADTSNNRIRKIAIDSTNDIANVRLPLTDSTLVPIGTVTTLGTTTYSQPLFTIFDTLGNMYVSCYGEHKIYKVTPEGTRTTLAGSGTAAFNNAVGAAASFNMPCGLAIDANNNIFVADHNNHRIRRIDSANNVTTVAGSGVAGAWGDGLGTAAQLHYPTGLAFDSLGNLFFSEQGTSHRIRMMAPNGDVTTIAGNGTGSYVDGTGTVATFINPSGIVFDSFGNLYIADQGNHRIRMITAASVRTTNGGVVTTFAGGSGAQWIDATGTYAAFQNPCGLCIDVNNNIYVGEQVNYRVRMITPGGVVTTIAGNGTAASVDGVSLNAQLNRPYGVTIDPTGQFLYVGANTSSSTIRRIAIGSIIGWGITSYLGNIVSPVLDNNGCTYMATQGQMNGYYIYKTTPGGFTYPIAGWNSTGTPVYTNSANLANLTCYKKINGLAVWPSGDIYVAETGNHCIRVLKPTLDSYAIWTYVGNKMALQGAAPVNLSSPRNVAIDPDYNLYVLDDGNSCIRKISANGSTSTFSTGVSSYGIAYDKVSGLLFITERVNHCVSSIHPITGVKTVIAGTSGTPGSTDGTSARFNTPDGIAVDTQGNLYVVDKGNNTIRRLTKSGSTWTTTTIVGSATGGSVNQDGIGTAARLPSPSYIAVATNGDLYVTCDPQGSYGCIKKITSGSWVVSTYFTFTGGRTGNASGDLRASGITIDSSNNLFVSAIGSSGHYIYRITNSEDGYVIAGSTTISGDGYSGGIDLPLGLCLDPYGNIFVAAMSNHAIRILVPRYISSVLAGNGAPAFADGAGVAARFNGPNSIALDRSGNIIVADTGNNRIRKVTPAGIVNTIGGTGAATSTGDAGLATAATFNAPTIVNIDWFGAIYVTENLAKIRVLYPNYNVSLLAGSNSGSVDGVGSAASFNTPTQIAWDNTNKVLWVADTGNNSSRTVTPSGLVKTYLLYANGINGVAIDPFGLTYVLIAGTTIGKCTPTRPPFTIGQLVAVDSNGVNVAYKKPVTTLSNKQLAFRAVSGSDANPYTSASTSNSEYLEVDLQQDCEITQVTCVNNTGSGIASGTQIIMYDAAFRQQDSRTMSGGSTQTVDFRYAVTGAPGTPGITMKFAPLLLTDSSKYVPDTTLAGYIRGQYIVLENNSTASKTITPPVLYDIYGKKLGIGITSPDSTALTTYGSKWEYDLGEEYCIRDIQYVANAANASIVIYNRLQAEVWRNYITTTITAPFPTQIPITSSAFTYPIRFVRISGAVTLTHVSVIDNRGIDVAVWKIVRKVSGTTVTFQAFNGLYNSNIEITGGATDRIEIDLGMAYNITNIQIYHTGTAPNLTVTTYGATGAQILGVPSSYIGSTNTLTTYKTNGLRTRYISVSAPSSTANINNLVIVDSLGRNVFLQYNTGNLGTYVGMTSLLKDTTAPVPTVLGKQSTTRSGNMVEFDLGREYNILYLVVYNNYTGSLTTTSNPTVGTTLTGTTIQFSDAYRNVMANRTIMGNMGVTYPIGNVVSIGYATPRFPDYVTVINVTPVKWQISITETVIATYHSSDVTIYGIAVSVSTAGNTTIYFTTNAGIGKWQNGSVTTLATKTGLRGIVLAGDTLYVCMSTNHQIGAIPAAGGTLAAISGSGYNYSTTYDSGHTLGSYNAYLDGTGLNSSYNNPTGIAKDSSNNLYIADTGNHLIRKLYYNAGVWTVTTVAGATYIRTSAYFGWGLDQNLGAGDAGVGWNTNRCAVGYRYDRWSPSANAWLCEADPNFRKVFLESGTNTNATGTAARFSSPQGIAVDSAGNIYVADTGNNLIRKIDTSKYVTNVAVITSSPKNISVDSLNTIYFTDMDNRLYTFNGVTKEIWDSLNNIPYSSGSTSTTDGYIKTSTPETNVVYPNSENKWPGMNSGAIEAGVPPAIIYDNQTANIANVGPVVFAGGSTYFLETSSNKIRRYYSVPYTSANARKAYCTAPSASTQASNTFTGLDNNSYFIPNSPFVGPFTQANAASALVSNTFVAQITTEVIDVSMPPPVTGLYFASITSTSISIGWVSGGGSGTSYIFTLNGAAVTPVLSALTATFNGLTPETVLYEIGVYTSNTNGSSFPATIMSYPNTTAPLLSVLSATSTSITVQWTGGDFTNYYTYTLDSLSLNPTVDNSKINKTVTFTRKADGATLVGNTEYRIVVISNRTTGTNFPSTTLIVKTAPVVPVLSFGTINQTLSWSGGDGATSYRILRNEVDMTSFATIDSVAKTIRFTNTLGNTVYTFILTAINANGSSESDPLTITTSPAVPVLIISGITATGVTVSWTGGDGASSYRFLLYLNRSSGTAYFNIFGKIQGANLVNGGGIVDVTAIAFSPTNAAQPPVFLAQDGINVRAVSAGATPNARYFVGTVADFRYDYYVAASASSPYSDDTGTTLVAHTSFTTPYPTITQTGSSITITNMISNSKYTVGIVAVNTNGESFASVDLITGGTFSATYSIPATIIPSNITSTSSSEITQSGFKITYAGGDRATLLTITITSNGAAVSGGYGSLYTYNISSKQVTFFGLNSARAYTVLIRATNTAGTSTGSTILITTLGISVVIKPPLTTFNSATIEWDPVPNATSYKYTVTSKPEQTTTSTGPLSVAGLTAGTSYTLTVNAFNVSNSQIATGTITFLTGPAAPTGLSQSSATYSSSSITVTWSSPPSTTLYPTTGYVFTVNGSPLTPTLSGNSAIFNNILPGSSNAITMKYSNIGDTATVTAYTLPAQPTITASSISSITANSFIITWASSAGTASYTVYYGSASIQVFPSGSSTLTATLSSLSPNTSYNVYIRATGNNSITSESNTISVLTAPLAPQNLSASSYTTSYGCRISWTGSAASYTITGFGSTGSTITGITNNWYDVTGQTAGTTYNITVIAVNNTASVASATISVLMIPGPITNALVTSITYDSYNINWGAPIGATTYEYSINAGANWISTGANTSVIISGQTPDSNHNSTILLRARNSSGISTNFSTTVLFAPTPPTVSTSDWNLSTYKVSYTGGRGATSWKITVNGTEVYSGSHFVDTGLVKVGNPREMAYPDMTNYSTNIFTITVTVMNESNPAGIISAPFTEYKPPLPFTWSWRYASAFVGNFPTIVYTPYFITSPIFATRVMVYDTNNADNNHVYKWNTTFSINPPGGSTRTSNNIPFVSSHMLDIDDPTPGGGSGHDWFRARAYNPRGVYTSSPTDLQIVSSSRGKVSTATFNINTGNQI